MKIHLIQQFYIKPERQTELNKAFRINLKNQNICYHQLVENQETADYINLIFKNALVKNPLYALKNIDQRLTFHKALDYAVHNIPKGDIIIISNSDIALEPLLQPEDINLSRLPQSLSRWDTDEKEQTNLDKAYIHVNLYTTWTHDAWVFLNDINLYNFAYAIPNKYLQLGKYGCDSEMDCYILSHYKKIYNDFNSIKIYHFHVSAFREWKCDDDHPFGYMLSTWGNAVNIIKTSKAQSQSYFLIQNDQYNEPIYKFLRLKNSIDKMNLGCIETDDAQLFIYAQKNILPLRSDYIVDNLDHLMNNYFIEIPTTH